MATRWLKFFSRSGNWDENELPRVAKAERHLIDAACTMSHRKAMMSLYYAGIHLVALGVTTSRDTEQWLAPDF